MGCLRRAQRGIELECWLMRASPFWFVWPARSVYGRAPGANEAAGGRWLVGRSIEDLPHIKLKCTFHNFRGFLRAGTKAVGVIGSGIWL
jgi:hypothetical protein